MSCIFRWDFVVDLRNCLFDFEFTLSVFRIQYSGIGTTHPIKSAVTTHRTIVKRESPATNELEVVLLRCSESKSCGAVQNSAVKKRRTLIPWDNSVILENLKVRLVLTPAKAESSKVHEMLSAVQRDQRKQSRFDSIPYSLSCERSIRNVANYRVFWEVNNLMKHFHTFSYPSSIWSVYSTRVLARPLKHCSFRNASGYFKQASVKICFVIRKLNLDI